MKPAAIVITIYFFGFALIGGCQIENEPDPPQSPVPVFDLGDTLRNNNNTSYEELNVVIDSSSQTGFKLTSTHDYVPMQSSTYFIRIEAEFEASIKFLDSLAFGGIVFAGPILSTFELGDTIRPNIANEQVFDWYPKSEVQMGNTSWLKYHIFTPQGSTIQHMKIGENHLVFKFGETGEERLGWLNVVYQDTICYVKEGYYNATPNQEIIVGEN